MEKQTISMSEIKIPDKLKDTVPSRAELAKIAEYIAVNRSIDKPIVLREDNVLVDGYNRWYAWNMLHPSDPIWCLHQTDTPAMVGGKFYGNDKEYYWKNTKRMVIRTGDLLLVENRDSVSLVRVTSVYNELQPKMKMKEVVENYTTSQAPWLFAIGLLNYLGIPLNTGVEFWQNTKTGEFAYEYDNEIVKMSEQQSLTFDALGWINEILK